MRAYAGYILPLKENLKNIFLFLHESVQIFYAFQDTAGGESLKKKISTAAIISKLGEMALGRGSDAVHLAFLDPESAQAQLDSLDLSMLSEIKRNSNGTVEIKLLNRLDALELLAKLVSEGGSQSAAEEFFRALQNAAEAKNGRMSELED